MSLPPQQPGFAGPGDERRDTPGVQQSGPPLAGPSSRRARRLLLLGGIGALLVMLLVVVVLAVSAGGSSPRDTAEAFVKAFNDRDNDGVLDTLCGTTRGEHEALGGVFAGLGPDDEEFRFELREVRETGGGAAEADLVAIIDAAGTEVPTTYQLVQEDGEWRFCGVTS